MKTVEFHPTAQEEADRAADDYEARQPGLGHSFRVELEQAVERISQTPLMYAVEIDNFRACPLHRFAYTLFYHDLDDRVWVAAVAHQKRKPGYWVRRQPS